MTNRSGLLWVALGASLWGTDTLLRRPLTASFTSSQIVFAEHIILSVVLLPVLWRSRGEWRKLGPRQWAAVAGIALGGSALGTLCFTEAIRLGNPTSAVLLQKLQPVFAALLAAALLGERLGVRFWAWLGLALAAAYLVAFGAAPPPEPLAAVPALLAAAAAALWGASTVLGRFVLGSISFTMLTALRIVVAMPLLAAMGGARLPAIHTHDALALLLLALVPGLLALLIYYRGLGRTLASRAAVAELSFPAVAALLNRLAFDTPVTFTQLAGFALLTALVTARGARTRLAET
jgi:drug/metabolite transporter (DMT)-like permease